MTIGQIRISTQVLLNWLGGKLPDSARILESSDPRIDESGDIRITE